MAAFKVLVCAFLVFGVELCGSNQSDNALRIVNGNFAVYSQFPYTVSLQEKAQFAQTTRGHSCGGALITLRHAVTSGSCLYSQTSPYVLKTPALYRVFAGDALLTNDNSVNVWRNVSVFTPHPNYNGPSSYANDIGIITLETSFLSTTVSPLAVSTVVPADNSTCVVSGWGATLAGSQASVNLMFINRTTINQTSCSSLSAGLGGPALLSQMLCVVNSTAYTPSCTNDTGNPLICGNTLTGVLSWHPACALTSTLDIYTKTADYVSWLNSITSGASLGTAPVAAMLLLVAATTRMFTTNVH